MKQHITLQHFLKLNGKFSEDRFELLQPYCEYSDENKNLKIISFKDNGENNGLGCPLYHFTFENGNTGRYAIFWIKVSVEFSLLESYF